MKISKKTIQTKEVELVENYLCNLCGKTLKAPDGVFRGIFNLSYLANLHGPEYEFDLCEPCIRKLASDCVISPIIKDDEII